MSLGRYLLPAVEDADESVSSQPLSDSEDEDPPALLADQVQQPEEEDDSFQFAAPIPLSQVSQPPAPAPQPSDQNLESSVSFVSWDRVVMANASEELSFHHQGESYLMVFNAS